MKIKESQVYTMKDEDLMHQFLTGMKSWGPPAFQVMWREMMTIGVYCIVRERHRLSIDDLKRDTEEKGRRHCSTIRKEIAYRLRSLVKRRAWSVKARITSVIDNKSYQAFVKDSVIPLQEVYCANNVLGKVTYLYS